MSDVEFRPNTAFLPRVLSPAHLDLPFRLSRLNPLSRETEDEAKLLCLVLHAFEGLTSSFYVTMVLTGVTLSPNKACTTGLLTSLPMLVRWVIPSGVMCYSTRNILWTALRGVPLESCGLIGITWHFLQTVPTPHPLAVVLWRESSVPTLKVCKPDSWLFCHSVFEVIQCSQQRKKTEWIVTNVTIFLWILNNQQSSLSYSEAYFACEKIL